MAGLFAFIGRLFSEDARHNHKIDKAGEGYVQLKTIGWRPDPFEGKDGYTPDPGNFREGKNGYDTSSGNVEYYKVIRTPKKKGK
jgi:hypothetical protein